MVPHLFGGMFVNIPGVTVIPRVHSLFWGLHGTFPILTSFLQLHILRGENKHKTTIIIKRE
jgi:hypothetical protein